VFRSFGRFALKEPMEDLTENRTLRRGWTTGACATAAARAAFEGLMSGDAPPDPVEIALPSGQRVAFAVAEVEQGTDFCRVGIIKDAGDDPDVTHGALICATVRPGLKGSGVNFCAGEGVGTVTRPGLPIPPGEPAINPVPRAMMRQAISEAAGALGVEPDAIIEISVPDGLVRAKNTLNARLGIIGGLSILGTTGVVIPFSCAAWIDSIHRSIDVARAIGIGHVAATTGVTSEKAVQAIYGLPEPALVEMGDFVGGFLKYLHKHPISRVTLGGGFAKMLKLSQGRLDLHSARSHLDLVRLAHLAKTLGADQYTMQRIEGSNTALEALQLCQAVGIDLASPVAGDAWRVAAKTLNKREIELEIIIFDRDGGMLARSPFKSAVL
jgi:cobalt-precorrin-5B (C1)-methyltransferase